jgi:zinc and cadmium transporter
MMEWWGFLLLFAGPMTGGIMGSLFKSTDRNRLKLFLAFSGAFLFSITVLSLIPEIYHQGGKYTGVFVLLGFFFQIILEQFSKGIEHGHLHVHPHTARIRIPYEVFAGLGLHSFLEGMPLGGNIFESGEVQNSLLFGIVLHEMPAAFALASILKFSGLSRQKIYLLLIFYACMAPAGAALSGTLVNMQGFSEEIFSYLMAMVIGTFLHISTTILFENSENHRFSRYKVVAIVLGTALAMLTLIGNH